MSYLRKDLDKLTRAAEQLGVFAHVRVGDATAPAVEHASASVPGLQHALTTNYAAPQDVLDSGVGGKRTRKAIARFRASYQKAAPINDDYIAAGQAVVDFFRKNKRRRKVVSAIELSDVIWKRLPRFLIERGRNAGPLLSTWAREFGWGLAEEDPASGEGTYVAELRRDNPDVIPTARRLMR